MTTMNDLPSEKLLIAYWTTDVGIGKTEPEQHVQVPLTDILKYTLEDGTPQIKVVMLTASGPEAPTFNGSPDNFVQPYINISDDLKKVLTVQPGQSESEVKQLQNKGIKVLLSVIGNGKMGGTISHVN